ncbi:hypothetical protein [Streptomyces sp. NPDC002851]
MRTAENEGADPALGRRDPASGETGQALSARRRKIGEHGVADRPHEVGGLRLGRVVGTSVP